MFYNSNVFYRFLLFQDLWICLAYFPSSIVEPKCQSMQYEVGEIQPPSKSAKEAG